MSFPGPFTLYHALDVNGNVGIVASGYLNFGTIDAASGYGVRDNGGVVECKNSGGSWSACQSSGSTFAAGSAASPGWAVSGNTNTGLFQATSNTLSIAAYGAEIARFDNSAQNADVNYFDFKGNATGQPIILGSAGSDTDVSIDIMPKGAGNVLFTNGSVGIGAVTLDPLFVQANNAGTASTLGIQNIDPAGYSEIEFEDNNGVVQGWIGYANAGGPFYVNPNNNEDMVVGDTGGTGKVGIGTLVPNHKLDVFGNIGISASGYLNFGTVDGTGGYGIRDNGGAIEFKNSGGAWGAIAAASDQRLKNNIIDLPPEDGLAAILKLRPVQFHWKDIEKDKDQGKQIGLIAQEVEKIFPAGVTGNFGDVILNLGEGKKETVQQARKLDYDKLIAPIIKAIQELDNKLKRLVSAPFVGSSSHPTGITMYDDVTGEPYCVHMHSGSWMHDRGACKPPAADHS
jgi:hypothetical protein